MRPRLRHHAVLTPTLLGLLAVGIVLTLLPRSLTDRAKNILQPLEWVRWAAAKGVNKTADALGAAAADQPDPAEFRTLRDEKERLERQVDHQLLRIEELTHRVDELANLRAQMTDPSATIVFASVSAADSSRARKSVTIDRGTEHGVKVGHWVASGVSFEQRGGAADGRALVARQTLIGWIDETHSYMSRVKLITDPGFRCEVQVARRLADGTLASNDRVCLLEGIGGGRMTIRNSPENFYNKDLLSLIVVPSSGKLPGRFMIGRIVSSAPVETAPLVFNMMAEPLVDLDNLRHVLVIVSGG